MSACFCSCLSCARKRQTRGKDVRGTRAPTGDVCLRALGKCRQYRRNPDHPPQLFPDQTIRRIGKCRAIGRGDQDFRKRWHINRSIGFIESTAALLRTHNPGEQNRSAAWFLRYFLRRHACDRLYSPLIPNGVQIICSVPSLQGCATS